MVGIDALIAALGEASVSLDPDDRAQRSGDWSAHSWLQHPGTAGEAGAAAVVFPASTEEVATVLAWAEATRTPIVPRGGGSGVVGGAVASGGVVVLDTARLERISDINTVAMTVTVGAGVGGEPLETELRRNGLTLGHYPQSLSLSTVGGWIASSAVGHASLGYGGIERLVVGLTVVLPGGRIVELRSVPRSAAGPDLRRLFIGSEGTLGVVTEATMAASRLPSGWRWLAFEAPTFVAACDVAREVAQNRVPALVLRAYDRTDAVVTFGEVGFGGEAVLIVAFDENLPGLDASCLAVEASARAVDAVELPGSYGEHWHEHHTDAIDLYRKIMGPERIFGEGVIVDTLEVAGLWHQVPILYRSVGAVLADAAELSGCHLSHAYSSGASLYFTFMLRAGDDAAAVQRHSECWDDIVAACHRAGGTMTHHHGVGLLRAQHLPNELGAGGLQTLRSIKAALDPHGIMNPGKLLPDD